MSFLYLILYLSVNHILRCAGECKIPMQDPYSQLSTTFLKGYWYEHLYTTKVLKNDPCSHFEIKCASANQSCEIRNEIWKSYLIIHLWNGTITQNDSRVILTQNPDEEPVSYDINLKFFGDDMLMWSCNDTDLAFASVLRRMKTDDEMENIWDEAYADMTFPAIIENIPAGIWTKNDPSKCQNDAPKYAPGTLMYVLFVVINVRKL
ncbi:uncharacterized protein LOC109536303 [Dendroctonus ponderosae]|uniref:Lipocalin/cytosolic fatty-acid binding domain-containing protein n=1 Tax=Dendroctonus ponderosae TaxID=77166 RepID=U4UQM2_DENPD|nr:uncharacterized protein LOC109536303 [Dendroctonus ponderosae]ERL92446.1 hypothetical protein D910_09760 [Dendroctonus ponderosae]KAH1014667.1 hypothetical protein HUJ05_012511 [Dendroctonus ponderosae]